MFLCGLLSFLIPETNGKTLAEIEGDEMYGGSRPQQRQMQNGAVAAEGDRSGSESGVEKVVEFGGTKVDV